MKLFTVEEANALIPRMEMLMERIQRCGLGVRHAAERLTGNQGGSVEDLRVAEVLSSQPEVQRLVQELEESISEIEACGGQFKGLDLGLVDFPAEIEGEIGLLCWQFGEKEITHWHRVDAGFAARQPLRDPARRSYLQ